MNKQKGFTLVELLIVIAIIGILAAIAIPQFSKYKERAARASAVSDAKNLASEIEAYFADHGEYPPPSTSFKVVNKSVVIIGTSDTFTLSRHNTMANNDYGTYTSAQGYSYTIHNTLYKKSVTFDSTKGGVDASVWK